MREVGEDRERGTGERSRAAESRGRGGQRELCLGENRAAKNRGRHAARAPTEHRTPPRAYSDLTKSQIMNVDVL